MDINPKRRQLSSVVNFLSHTRRSIQRKKVHILHRTTNKGFEWSVICMNLMKGSYLYHCRIRTAFFNHFIRKNSSSAKKHIWVSFDELLRFEVAKEGC